VLSCIYGIIYISITARVRIAQSGWGLGCGHDDWKHGLISSKSKTFFFSINISKPGLGLTQPPVWWVPEPLSVDVKFMFMAYTGNILPLLMDITVSRTKTK
jgi:hypothetical protein